MEAIIQRWGDSQGIRIPKFLLKSVGLSVGDRVELSASSEGILIRKAHPREHRTLAERFESFYGWPFSETPREASAPEVDWGEPRGKEIS